MANVVQTENLSEHIVRDTFRDSLRANAGAQGSKEYLIDPEDANRDDAHPFIVTSFPDTKPLYPMIVVREGADSAERPDRRHDLHEHQYQVLVQYAASSSTAMFQLRDGIKAWFEDNIEFLESEGFEDATIGNASRADWDSEVSTASGQIPFGGIVNTI
jgi:hypothetical protein